VRESGRSCACAWPHHRIAPASTRLLALRRLDDLLHGLEPRPHRRHLLAARADLGEERRDARGRRRASREQRAQKVALAVHQLLHWAEGGTAAAASAAMAMALALLQLLLLLRGGVRVAERQVGPALALALLRLLLRLLLLRLLLVQKASERLRRRDRGKHERIAAADDAAASAGAALSAGRRGAAGADDDVDADAAQAAYECVDAVAEVGARGLEAALRAL